MHSKQKTKSKIPKSISTGSLKSPRSQKNKKCQSADNLSAQELSITIENVNLANENGDTLLIQSVRNNNIKNIQTILSFDNTNVNHQNIWKNTALHYASIFKNEHIIHLLLNDSRTDASLKNDENLRPRDCYDRIDGNEKDERIKTQLFFRAMLNIAVHEESFATLVSGAHNEEKINLTIEAIKAKMQKEHTLQQGDRALPTNTINIETGLPTYATDDFLKKMVKMKLK